MDIVPVFSTSDIPKDIMEKLKDYYSETDQREILNDSYTRYPYLFDFGESPPTDIDIWFMKTIYGFCMYDYIIIHWEW